MIQELVLVASLEIHVRVRHRVELEDAIVAIVAIGSFDTYTKWAFGFRPVIVESQLDPPSIFEHPDPDYQWDTCKLVLGSVLRLDTHRHTHTRRCIRRHTQHQLTHTRTHKPTWQFSEQ